MGGKEKSLKLSFQVLGQRKGGGKEEKKIFPVRHQKGLKLSKSDSYFWSEHSRIGPERDDLISAR